MRPGAGTAAVHRSVGPGSRITMSNAWELCSGETLVSAWKVTGATTEQADARGVVMLSETYRYSY